MFLPSVARPRRRSLIEILRTLNLTTNLQMCMDAGNSASYSGSGTQWLDVSGNGLKFDFGAGAAAPTFNGTAGRLSSSEYFSFDGGDYLTLNGSNPSWVESCHKDNAVFTLIFWLYFGSIATQRFFGTDGNAGAQTGFDCGINGSGNALLQVRNAGAAALSVNNSVVASSATAWTFWAISQTEATPTGLWRKNTTTSSSVTSYTSPSAGSASFALQIGAGGNGITPLTSGSRIAAIAAFNTALTANDMLAVFNAIRNRFGV